MASGVMKFISVCEKIEEIMPKDQKNSSVSTIKAYLTRICNIIDEVVKQDEEENARKNQGAAQPQTLIESYEKKFLELQNKIESVEKSMTEKLKTADSKIENRTVSVLMNTIAILSLFVAIAFTGFGTLSIFKEVRLDFVNEYFKSIALLFIVAFLTYNLILILLYFVCKVALGEEKYNGVQLFGRNFWKSLLFWIDVVLLVSIIVLFWLVSLKVVA